MVSRHKLQGVFVEPIADQLDNPDISDIFINGDRFFYVIASGKMRRLEPAFVSEKQVREFAQYWIGLGGRRIDEGLPYGDVTIRYGGYNLRFHAVLGVLSDCGTTVSIRIHRQYDKTLKAMVGEGFLTVSDAARLSDAVKRRRNILISGATGSGKTTLLNALVNGCPEDERIVVIEDSSEIRTMHPHCISLRTRQKNIENKGEITAEELVFQALRMKPDRLIVGEFRGRETHSLLSAFNTGHSGFATVHANSLAEVRDRLETLCLLDDVPAEVAARYARSTFTMYVHTEQEKGARRISRMKEGEGIIRRGERDL